MNRTTRFIFFLLFASGILRSETKANSIVATGTFPSPTGRCSVTVSVSAMGGFKVLELSLASNVEDVTGLYWISASELAYSVSPVYGRPGIYIYDCQHKQSHRIVRPKHIDAQYPRGADYFELSNSKNGVIYYFYAPNVDDVDFANFRSEQFLYRVNQDGSRRQRVASGK